ncbi:inositol monophosphatase family protein [Patescibacteria group bacterium]
MKINPEISREVVVEMTREAGDFLYDSFGEMRTVEEKSPKNYVTDADRKSEKIIISTIKKKFPDHEILAEESGRIGEKSDFLWVIDPLDGTHNYIVNIPIWGVSIALCFKKRPVIGAIYLPCTGEMYEAGFSKGAFLNGKRINVSAVKLLEDSFILSEGAMRRKRLEKVKIFKLLTEKVKRVRLLGSTVSQLAYLAAGRVEGFIGPTGYPWDYAAGSLIIKEAGGKATNLRGRDWQIDSAGFMATNGKIHNQLLKLIK